MDSESITNKSLRRHLDTLDNKPPILSKMNFDNGITAANNTDIIRKSEQYARSTGIERILEKQLIVLKLEYAELSSDAGEREMALRDLKNENKNLESMLEEEFQLCREAAIRLEKITRLKTQNMKCLSARRDECKRIEFEVEALAYDVQGMKMAIEQAGGNVEKTNNSIRHSFAFAPRQRPTFDRSVSVVIPKTKGLQAIDESVPSRARSLNLCDDSSDDEMEENDNTKKTDQRKSFVASLFNFRKETDQSRQYLTKSCQAQSTRSLF